jgi:ribonuclease Z
VGQLVLTHLSPRYLPGNPTTPDDLLGEARAIFSNTLVARDFLSIDVSPEEPATGGAAVPPPAANATA